MLELLDVTLGSNHSDNLSHALSSRSTFYGNYSVLGR